MLSKVAGKILQLILKIVNCSSKTNYIFRKKRYGRTCTCTAFFLNLSKATHKQTSHSHTYTHKPFLSLVFFPSPLLFMLQDFVTSLTSFSPSEMSTRYSVLSQCFYSEEGKEPALPPLLHPADHYKLRYRVKGNVPSK